MTIVAIDTEWDSFSIKIRVSANTPKNVLIEAETKMKQGLAKLNDMILKSIEKENEAKLAESESEEAEAEAESNAQMHAEGEAQHQAEQNAARDEEMKHAAEQGGEEQQY